MTEHENLISVPPDGGWGWVIVMVCFYSMVVIDIPSFGFQIIADELRDLLKLSAPQVSVFFSVYTMCMFLMGPIAGGVCNRFGFRMTTMIGSTLMIIGLGSSYFVSHYFAFLFLYGLTAGCGTSFVLMVANVATGFWFESKRTIAMGIVSSANGASVFTIGLTTYVAETFGWRYCFLAWAGLIVILFLGAFLLAPPPMIELEANTSLVGPANEVDLKRVTVIIPLEYEKSRVRRLSERKLRKISTTTGIPLGRLSRPSVSPTYTPVGMGKFFRCCLWCNCFQQTIGSRPLYRKDIFAESIVYAARKDHKDGTILPLTMSKLPTSKDVTEEVECTCTMPEAVTRAIKEMVDWSLLCSPIFLLLLVSSICVYIVRYIPFLVIKKFNLPYMPHNDASKALVLMGFGSFIARGTIGFILYFCNNISALATTIFVTVTGGTVLCCLIITHSVYYQLTMCFLAGSLTSLVITLRSLIIIDLLGLSRLTSCTGLLFFLQGFASFLGMPIAEILKEKTGSHTASLIFAGCGYIMAGFFNICLALISCGKRKQ